MATTTPLAHVTVEEYLNTEYEPDCDYIDGVLEDRNVGKKRHGRTQARLSARLLLLLESQGKDVATEQRVRISPSRIRIPDVCVFDVDDNDDVQYKPPALWVEILSPQDRFSRVLRRVQDALDFGVPTIWIVDPYERQAWIGTPTTGIVEAKDQILRCEALELQVSLDEIIPAP